MRKVRESDKSCNLKTTNCLSATLVNGLKKERRIKKKESACRIRNTVVAPCATRGGHYILNLV